jgi:hypothetical protein
MRKHIIKRYMLQSHADPAIALLARDAECVKPKAVKKPPSFG